MFEIRLPPERCLECLMFDRCAECRLSPKTDPETRLDTAMRLLKDCFFDEED